MFLFHASSTAIVSIAFALFNLCWHSLSCYQKPDYNQEMSVAYDFLSLHLWLKFITFMVSQIVIFTVKTLFHAWVVVYYIYGWFLLHLR